MEFLRGYTIEQDGQLYLDRLKIVDTRWIGVYLHRIHKPDYARDPHDHPWIFASFILSGGYLEEIKNSDRPFRYRTRGRFSLRTMHRDQAHRIISVWNGPWTLVVTGRKHYNGDGKGDWGFWTSEGRIPWQEYLKDNEQ